MPSSSSSSLLASRTLPAALCSLPALLYVRDKLGGFCRVRGASMEPDLRDGDVLWVRKADAGTLIQAMRATLLGGATDSHAIDSNSVDEEERRRVVRYEVLQGITNHVGLFSARPPAAIAGDIVVYQNPTQLQRELLVKRCIGVGGQWIRQEHPADPYYQKNQAYQYRLQALQPFTLYVEGSNRAKSIDDSRTHGPISKNLVVGIAEYCVWPPTRWQRLRRKPQMVDGDDMDGTPRAVWY